MQCGDNSFLAEGDIEMQTNNFQLTDIGIDAPTEFTTEEWSSLGNTIAANSRRVMWHVGDWILLGETSGYLPRGKLPQAADRFGIKYKTAKDAAFVCRRFEKRFRHPNLSYGHHQSVASLRDNDEAREVFEWAVSNGATVQLVRQEVNRRRKNASLRFPKISGQVSDERWKFIQGDCRTLPFPDDHFDLVLGSPPYETQRDYEELNFDLSGEEWVAFAIDCFCECLRVSRGLVAWVVAGHTKDFCYSATPERFVAELYRRGVKLRKPLIFHRRGIPGSGGPDWLRSDYELIVCATKSGKLPWSDPTATGSPPRKTGVRRMSNRSRNGNRSSQNYTDPDLVNPGDVVSVPVGNGLMGSNYAHYNEAPFPQALADFFVRSFCPPNGLVLDPFSGSGTTVAAAVEASRRGIGVDVRQSQVELGIARLNDMFMTDRFNGCNN